MKLSEQLKQDHESGDFGTALAGYAERAALLEEAIIAIFGQEDMSIAQEKCYEAYISITQ